MGPLPQLLLPADAIPDDPRTMSNETWSLLVTDVRTLVRYIQIQHARCGIRDAVTSPKPEATPPR